ncbi:MAG: dihydrofolate reductase [Candidatus Komeilibacteria bacterium]|nr:dihydrofolate reductase [Candidatus Komeilibacteria bacterium]
MTIPRISIIAAIDNNRGLGRDNKLLWHIKTDLQRFKKLTTGHTIIMGRKTYESIGKPLPERVNIVLSRRPVNVLDNVMVVKTLEESLEEASRREEEEIFIIGGGQIYSQTMDLADRLYLTVVDGDYGADTFFPAYDMFDRVIDQREEEENGIKLTFLTLER